jgi:hypothetical protein
MISTKNLKGVRAGRSIFISAAPEPKNPATAAAGKGEQSGNLIGRW